MHLEEKDFMSFHCPHCQVELTRYHNASRTGKEVAEYRMDEAYFSDGDCIPFDLNAFDPTLSWDCIGTELLVGACPTCQEDYYAMEVKLSSEPIENECFPSYMGGDFYYISVNGTQRVYETNSPYPHIVVSSESTVIQAEDEVGIVTNTEHHILGPFPLQENVSGENGVSIHEGKHTWRHGSDLLSHILTHRKNEMFSKA